MDKYGFKYFDYPDRIVEWLNEHQNEIINFSTIPYGNKYVLIYEIKDV